MTRPHGDDAPHTPAPAFTERLTAIGQLMARLESAATDRRWADVAAASKELLSVVSKILQRAHVLAELQAEGTIDR